MSFCYQILYRNCDGQELEEAHYKAAMTGMSSLRVHDRRSIIQGVNNQQYFHAVLVHQYNSGNHDFVVRQLPVVLRYLCTLIDNIGFHDVDGVRSDANAQLHHTAQERLADILTGELFHYVIENVHLQHQNEKLGLINTIGVFPMEKVDFLEQLLAHKESFEVFGDKQKVERIAELMKEMYKTNGST